MRNFVRSFATNTSSKPPMVRHDEQNHMFYLEMQGLPPKESPRTEYKILGPKQWSFFNTETPEQMREKGYGTIVVDEALKVAKDRGIDTSTSTCSFVKSVVQEGTPHQYTRPH